MDCRCYYNNKIIMIVMIIIVIISTTSGNIIKNKHLKIYTLFGDIK